MGTVTITPVFTNAWDNSIAWTVISSRYGQADYHKEF